MSYNFGGNRIKISDFSRTQVSENLPQALTEFLLQVGREFFGGA